MIPTGTIVYSHTTRSVSRVAPNNVQYYLLHFHLPLSVPVEDTASILHLALPVVDTEAPGGSNLTPGIKRAEEKVERFLTRDD
jgi:hypothetical protein